ncbi:MAG TPA: family 16 glycosylhydrolase [Myxococcota bacterium]|nr:family 16 glycosylhydrolase [Myxococcota bacterium]
MTAVASPLCSTLLAALLSLCTLAACGSEPATGESDSPEVFVPDTPLPDVAADTHDSADPGETSTTDTSDAPTPDTGDTQTPDTGDTQTPDTTPDDTGSDTADAATEDTTSPDTEDTASPDTEDTEDTTTEPDTSPPGPVTVSRRHWRLVFEDEFKGPRGDPSDDYCYRQLPPQCHVWPGGSHHCDQSDVAGEGFYPPLRANLIQALSLFFSRAELDPKTTPELRTMYGELIRERLADLDKCSWTLYSMLNWMATDYAGRYSARFDATQVTVDTRGKGTLELHATYAPIQTSCIFGGAGGNPNCQLHAFEPNVLKVGVSYWVDPDPRWPGVYYAPPTPGSCPHGGTFTGVNCIIHAFPPNVLEARNVSYWADPDPRWPGVYYANQTYACRDNIDYSPSLGFRNLTCPILNGGLMSYVMNNRPYVGPDGTRPRGYEQHRGRFEAKVKIPKGLGAFPAAWLMPKSGGWPYDGGEIDVIEARDNADEVYQTYHHGRCYLESTGAEIDATDSADCANKGGKTTHLSKGFTTRQRLSDQFWKRFHLYAVEWTTTPSGDRLDYYLNNVHIGTVAPGTTGRIDEGAPSHLANFAASNFPTAPFYWILNHSTWVAPERVSTWQPQTFRLDYVRNYVECGTDPGEYCPNGGTFTEGLGCTLAGRITPSPCAPNDRPCVNGGTPDGDRCRVWDFAEGQLVQGVAYWVDADPRWPGVFYAKVGGACPHGGSGEVNCQLLSLPADLLEDGITYAVDVARRVITYSPDFR